jgi:hypothetical protein
MGEESSCYEILNSKGIPPMYGSPRDSYPPNQFQHIQVLMQQIIRIYYGQN